MRNRSQDEHPLANLTVEKLAADPHRFGLPTFAEYCKNRDKWMGRPDDAMVSITEGPKNHRAGLQRIIYKIHGVTLPSEESVEAALGDHGYGLDDIDLKKQDSRLKKTIEVIPQGAGKYDIVVDFLP